MAKDSDPFEITPLIVLQAYAAGIFPMAESRDATTMHWVDPRTRGVLPLDGLHVSRSLRKRIRRAELQIQVDRDFRGVIGACAARDETWINDEIRQLFMDLHQLGAAHSIEVRDGAGTLVGGLYGLVLGGAFFGESMFSDRPDASKIALVWLVARLRRGGFQLLDTQFVTDHLLSLGAREVSRADYHRQLERALAVQSDWSALPEDASVEEVLQLSTQTS
ncbi:MAG: leucyl/phenylalanyl-tRNA--protein transferase [Pseudomonadota bacterium]